MFLRTCISVVPFLLYSAVQLHTLGKICAAQLENTCKGLLLVREELTAVQYQRSRSNPEILMQILLIPTSTASIPSSLPSNYQQATINYCHSSSTAWCSLYLTPSPHHPSDVNCWLQPTPSPAFVFSKYGQRSLDDQIFIFTILFNHFETVPRFRHNDEDFVNYNDKLSRRALGNSVVEGTVGSLWVWSNCMASKSSTDSLVREEQYRLKQWR